MQSNTLTELLTPLSRTAKILWLALTFSIVLYGGLIFFVVPQMQLNPNPGIEDLERIFFGVSAMLAVASILVRNVFLSDQFMKRQLNRGVSSESLVKNSSGGLKAETLAKLNELSLKELSVFSIARSQLVGSIICWALNEGIAVLGLALAFLSGSSTISAPFVIIAFLLNLFMYPRLSAVPKRVSELHFQ